MRRLIVPFPAQLLQPRHLLRSRGGVHPRQAGHRRRLRNIFVHPHHHPLARVNLPLVPEGGVANLPHLKALLNGRHRPPQIINAADVFQRGRLQPVGQIFHIPGAAQGIDHIRHAALVGQYLLRPQGQLRRFLGRQAQRLVPRIDMKRLRPAQHRRQRLHRAADDIVVRLLRRQRHAGGLRMKTQHH